MPLKLNTPYDPGHNDPGHLYPHVAITAFVHNWLARGFHLEVQWGTWAKSGWKPGKGAIARQVGINNEDYDTVAKAVPKHPQDTPALQALEGVLYGVLAQQLGPTFQGVELTEPVDDAPHTDIQAPAPAAA